MALYELLLRCWNALMLVTKAFPVILLDSSAGLICKLVQLNDYNLHIIGHLFISIHPFSVSRFHGNENSKMYFVHHCRRLSLNMDISSSAHSGWRYGHEKYHDHQCLQVEWGYIRHVCMKGGYGETNNHTMHTTLAFFNLVWAFWGGRMGGLAGICIHREFDASLLHTLCGSWLTLWCCLLVLVSFNLTNCLIWWMIFSPLNRYW